uniref:Uncharacterized protein LOC114336163 n=1 Tax=Diabrotica virgifera virgifera TaxID=50390 RepID=A0A6P7G5J9_DIAVI
MVLETALVANLASRDFVYRSRLSDVEEKYTEVTEGQRKEPDEYMLPSNIIMHHSFAERNADIDIDEYQLCVSCNFLYKNEAGHICEHFQNTAINDLCCVCGILTEDLENHLKNAHNQCSDLGIIVQQSEISHKYSTKHHYCFYCGKLQTKLARHLERQHSDENEVKEALEFVKGSSDRRKIFYGIQKQGDFINAKNGNVVGVRRSSMGNKIPCPYCKGFYSKNNLRTHVKKYCSQVHREQNVQLLSRRILSNYHENACEILREEIFPSMRDDDITANITHDNLVIAYANQLATKYSSSRHHYNMIRNRMRHISRVLTKMKKISNTISDTQSIFDPQHFDFFIQAVHRIAGFTNGKFSVPSFGPSSVTLFSQLGDVLETEAIKRKDIVLEQNVQRFLKLLRTTSNSLINKVAIANRTQIQRTQKVMLPFTHDVRLLFTKLEEKIASLANKIKLKFTKNTWVELTKLMLVKLMVYNRKRPGDVEKAQIIEYRNLQIIDETSVRQLDETEQIYAQNYGRFITRGKLNSPASVLVSKLDMESIPNRSWCK